MTVILANNSMTQRIFRTWLECSKALGVIAYKLRKAYTDGTPVMDGEGNLWWIDIFPKEWGVYE